MAEFAVGHAMMLGCIGGAGLLTLILLGMLAFERANR
jgi:hypothetical protein